VNRSRGRGAGGPLIFHCFSFRRQPPLAATGHPVGSLPPADGGVRDAVDLREVGLDVYERRALHGVEAPNLQFPAGDLQKLDDPDADGVWPVRRPGGEDPVLLSVVRRKGLEHAPIRPVEPVEEDEVGSTPPRRQGRGGTHRRPPPRRPPPNACPGRGPRPWS